MLRPQNIIYRWLAMNIRPDLCLNALDMAEARAAANIMGEEMSGIVEGTSGLALGTDGKSVQEACHTGNQMKDKRTAGDTAVLRRSVDMNTYISSQETSRHEHPQHYVETWKISNSRPSNEARSLPRQVKTSPHVWTGRHGVSVSVRQ